MNQPFKQKTRKRPSSRAPYPMKDHIGVLVHEVARARRTAFDAVLQPVKITRAQRWVLVYLSQLEGKGISQKELAARMKLGQVALGEKLALMESSGWIERHVDEFDRRSKLIFMTDLGYEILDYTKEVSQQMNKMITKGIASADINTAEVVLREMLKNIRRLSGQD